MTNNINIEVTKIALNQKRYRYKIKNKNRNIEINHQVCVVFLIKRLYIFVQISV